VSLAKKPRQPVQKRSKEREQKILDAAEEIIRSEGWGAASSHAIARQAGVPPAGVYHFFPDRFMIYDALVARKSYVMTACFRTRITQFDVKSWADIVDVVIDSIADYCAEDEVARELSFGCDGEFSTRWSSSTHRDDVADVLSTLIASIYDIEDIDGRALKFRLAADFILTGFTQSVAKGDPLDEDILQEMREAVVAYVSTWIGDPACIGTPSADFLQPSNEK